MCGILGVVGAGDATGLVIDGLRRLEYRGYDSAGIAVVTVDGLIVQRAVGVVDVLAALARPVGPVGIGHTRWATHGAPSERNAHPHGDCSGRIAVVHNGIIENHGELRAALEARGHVFTSDTDTEVLAHLIEERHAAGLTQAVRDALAQVHGSYAVAVVSMEEPDRIVAARMRSPLLIGLAEGQNFLASDALALLPHTRRVVILADGDVAELTSNGVALSTLAGVAREAVVTELAFEKDDAGKGEFEHHMLKEIYEIPEAFRRAIEGRLKPLGEQFGHEGKLPEATLRKAKRILVVACGTSHYAGVVGKSIVEKLAGVPVEVQLASEFRYAPYVGSEGTVAVFVSQSGETADTLEALRKAREVGCPTLAFVNVAGSSLAREADGSLHLRAGPEIGVASTKAFVNTLGAFYLLGLHLGRARGSLSQDALEAFAAKLDELPLVSARVFAQADELRALGREMFLDAPDAFFLGRQIGHGLALEGALKLKEISYVHAEGYAAGELKHGPLALLSDGVPVTALVPTGDGSHAVMLSNIMEVKARGAKVLGILNEGDREAAKIVDRAFFLPPTDPLLFPVPACIALYLLAYHAALARGCAIDKPRNLAKSVTVE